MRSSMELLRTIEKDRAEALNEADRERHTAESLSAKLDVTRRALEEQQAIYNYVCE